MNSIYTVIITVAAVTFFWRATGAILAGRIDLGSAAFRYAFCIAFAMIAALVVKLIAYPQGVNAEVPLVYRLTAIAATLLVFKFSRHNIVLSAWCGVGTLLLLINAS